MRNLWNGRLNNIYFESLIENDFLYNLGIYFCLSSIFNNFFDFGCFDCLIYYIYFVSNFVNFFDLEIFRYSYFHKVIIVYNYYKYLGEVFLNYFYCESFCLVNSELFSCTDKRIYLVLYVSVVCSDFLVVFVYIQRC